MNEAELFDDERAGTPDPFLEEGTVGWSGSAEIAELGIESGDGMSLVRVTLFQGHPVGEPQSADGLANGRQIFARPMGPLYRIPKRGQRVIVAFPGGDRKTAGNAVILGTVGATPSSRFGRRKTILDFGDDDMVIVGKSISLVVEHQTEDGATHRHVISVSRDGGAQVVSDGSGLFTKNGEVNAKAIDASGNLKTALVLTQTAAVLQETATPASPSAINLKAGNLTISGGFVSLAFTTSLGLGANASPAFPVLLGMSGPSGVPSTCIWGEVTP